MSEAVIASWMLDGRAVAEQARVRAAAQALAEDDPAGLGPLYYLLADRVYGLALWISGSEAEAADTAQDTFVRVWQKRRYVAAARDPLSYVLGMARSVAIDRLRRNRLDATEGVETLLAPVLDEPERRLDAQRVSKLLLRLPLAQRAWWLGWAATMLLLLLLQAAPPAAVGEPSQLRRWHERLRQVEAEMAFDDAVAVGAAASTRESGA